jgi:hypothetical protein
MRMHAGRKAVDHLLLDHPIRGRDDETDACRHGDDLS